MTVEFENPAATADVEQHARQEIVGARARAAAFARIGAGPLAALAAGLAAWLILRRRRR